MCYYAFFPKDPSQWDEVYQSLWGCHNIYPILEQFHIVQVTQPELSSLTCLLEWSDPKRFCSNMAFLLIMPKEGITGERVYGLAMVWVHPYQARVSTIDDMAKKLILLASAGGPIHLCSSTGMPFTCLSQRKITWVPWWRRCLATSHVEGSANWRSINFCIQRPE